MVENGEDGVASASSFCDALSEVREVDADGAKEEESGADSKEEGTRSLEVLKVLSAETLRDSCGSCGASLEVSDEDENAELVSWGEV